MANEKDRTKSVAPIKQKQNEGDPLLIGLRDLGGSKADRFNNQLANSTLATTWRYEGISADAKDTLDTSAFVALMAFKPADEIEGMIAAQAVAMHYGVMECARRSMIPGQGFLPEKEYRKAAANMSRAFTELLAALDRKRGKGGQQKVTVEHVHVHSGGQAIVGNVAPVANAGGGGGSGKKIEGGPHAPPARLAHDAAIGAVIPPLRCADPERDALPVARDDERPL